MRPRIPAEALAFDLDGVLVDSESINVRSAFDAFAAFGLRLSDDDARRIVGLHPLDYVPRFAARFGLSEARREELMRYQGEIYRRLWNEEARPTDGAQETIRGLWRAGRRLALATSAGRRHAEHCLERLGIAEAFEFVLTKDDVTRRKPDPEVYRSCADRFGIRPGELLVVEDSPVGIAAAAAAGARCVALRTAHTPRAALERADAVLDSLRELTALLA